MNDNYIFEDYQKKNKNRKITFLKYKKPIKLHNRYTLP